ncbi:uncharacterized protein [Primulina huaijiensis]|uniref:uncharacterized protein n=1 Tax=Primulina huaijiensis TaxID=1492673 RepID=UPI003CC7543B
MELNLLTQSCPPPKIFKFSALFAKNSSQRCKLHLQRISLKSPDKKSLVHVFVKQDETLSSISKLYGVPILEIATSGKDIEDSDLIFEGKHLDAPSPIIAYAQVRHFGGGEWLKNKLSKTSRDLGFRGREWNQIIMKPSHHPLISAKTTSSFLVLVPLVAFCIGCIMVAIRIRNAKDLRNQEPQMSGVHQRMSKSTRWRTALSDLTNPDGMDTECEPDSAHVSEDEDQPHIYEHSGDCAKVEDDYQKFLSECGMSEWGYWRGGSPK